MNNNILILLSHLLLIIFLLLIDLLYLSWYWYKYLILFSLFYNIFYILLSFLLWSILSILLCFWLLNLLFMIWIFFTKLWRYFIVNIILSRLRIIPITFTCTKWINLFLLFTYSNLFFKLNSPSNSNIFPFINLLFIQLYKLIKCLNTFLF